MWLKLLFLLLYFLVLFVLARFFEAVVWYETGLFATQFVDPVTLSFRKLKTILECRGLGYSGLAEKRDVSELVEKSGDLMQGELYSAINHEKDQTGTDSSTSFSGEMHFYELVEDTKDGIWLVQVIAQDRKALLSKANWGKLVQKVSQLGIRTGTFNCSSDVRYCHKRGWMRSTLIMSVPQTYASKGKVMLKEYDGRNIEAEHIFKWMTSHVASRIKTVRHSQHLAEEWRASSAHPVKMFLFARLAQPPAFFSSLSVKYTGRIEFIFVDVHRWDNQSSLAEVGVTQTPSYILKMPEGIYHYGNSTGEFISLEAMDTFLRSVQPEVNDMFFLSLVLVNLLAWMDLFVTQGATVKRFVVLIRTLGTYNSLLLGSWLPVLGLLQLPYLDSLYCYSLKVLRCADTTALASWVRADWTFYSSHPALFLSTYLAHGLLIDYFEKKRRAARADEETVNNLEWLSSLWDWYASCLLHPIGSLHHIPGESDWEDTPNFMLQRLAFPDLWLRPLIPMDYIKDLPTWHLKCVNSETGSESSGEEGGETWNDVEGSSSGNTDITTETRMGFCQICSDQAQTGAAPFQTGSHSTPCSDCEQDCDPENCVSASSCCHGDRGTVPLCTSREMFPPGNRADWWWWPGEMLRCSECVVCLENFELDCLLMGLPCGHAFHQQCIVVWLEGGRHCCPVCRWPSYKKKPVSFNPVQNPLEPGTGATG
ncbi:E3 ubiquitin-protein ligase RNF103 [Aplochiton taeniatus]